MEPLTAAMDPKVIARIDRDTYRIEKVEFQTFEGVRMPGLLYLPKKEGKHPAVLHVHGHWKGAKQDPVVQARCVAQVRAGFVVLCVDAFGAGERAIGTALGEYHGEMTGATLLPTGMPLSAVQVLENMRAVDYLLTRPEVDGKRLGITGASGGGNQTMYAGAWDKRFGAVVPVCSVGTYNSYLGAACCMCEVVPGALQFTEEDGILALTAPRPLMVINASRDARQFSPQEAAKSIASARRLYPQGQGEALLVHKVFESGHDYSKPMREAMIGFMRKHLMGVGSGEPYPEAPFTAEPPESLRLYPDATRPADFLTLPQFAARRAKALLAAKEWQPNSPPLPNWAQETRQKLSAILFGQVPIPKGEDKPVVTRLPGGKRVNWSPEPGIRLNADVSQGEKGKPIVIVLHEGGAAAVAEHPVGKALKKAGVTMIVPEFRALGRFALPSDRIGSAPDHNSAEWSLWLGRPLAGQWCLDVIRLLDQFESLEAQPAQPKAKNYLIGLGSLSTAAICAGALDQRLEGVMVVDGLQTWVTEKPYRNQRLANILPGVLAEVGDVAHLMALVAPKSLVVVRPVDPQGNPLSPTAAKSMIEGIRTAWPEPNRTLWIDEDPVRGLSQMLGMVMVP